MVIKIVLHNALLSECPDHVILSEGPAETDMTVKELDRSSAKVYEGSHYE